MPYIKLENRGSLKLSSESVALAPGPLNFQITFLVNEYLRHNSLSYQTINDIVGALEGAKLEFYRRVAVPYENAKMAENGDVYS